MKYAFTFVILVLILFSLSSITIVSSADVSSISMHILGEEDQIKFGQLKLVAGIWHQLNITLDDDNIQRLNLIFFKGNEIPTGEKNSSNYYEWTYDESSENIWNDPLKHDGRNFIDVNNSIKLDNLFSFYIGIKDTLPNNPLFYHENWTLEISFNEEVQHTEKIVVEKPTLAFAKSHGDIINFFIEPFIATSLEGDDTFRIENNGNLPLDISIDYLSYNDFIKLSDSNTRISPYSNRNFYINLQSGEWKPGIAGSSISSTLVGSISSNIIVPTSVLTFQSAYQINAPLLKIHIGHNNYEIIEIEGTDIVFQHIKNLKMNESEIRNIPVYISGNGTVNFNARTDGKNISILNIKSENADVTTPFEIISTETSEYEIIFQIEAIRENKIGYLYYDLEIENSSKTYVTVIEITSPSDSQGLDLNITPITTIIVIICIILVIAYVSFTHIKHRRK